MTTTEREKTQEEFMDTLRQLSPENKLRALRMIRLMAAQDGFSEAYSAFVDQNGGIEAMGPEAVDHFMDEWEANHNA